MKEASSNEYLSNMEATPTNIPYVTGYSLKRWRQGTNCMIEKPGNWRVEKLRMILLYEADFNFLNNNFRRDAIRQEETHNEVAAEQYGSWQVG